MEVTKINKTQIKNITHQVVYIDHRFQLIKLQHKNTKTIIIINSDKSQEEIVRRHIEKELINTDFYLINDNIKNLVNIINNLI